MALDMHFLQVQISEGGPMQGLLFGRFSRLQQSRAARSGECSEVWSLFSESFDSSIPAYFLSTSLHLVHILVSNCLMGYGQSVPLSSNVPDSFTRFLSYVIPCSGLLLSYSGLVCLG